MVRQDAAEHGMAPSPREVDVEQDHIGEPLSDELDGGAGLVGLAHHLDRVAQLGADSRPENGMVLDQEDTGAPAGLGTRHWRPLT